VEPGNQQPARGASPERIAKIVRSQWITENRLHFVRDTAFREDASKVRTGHGPENMATLRSFAINQLRTAGHTNIAGGSARWPSTPSNGR
jgi:predicted transposase YbfD/YdcC